MVRLADCLFFTCNWPTVSFVVVFQPPGWVGGQPLRVCPVGPAPAPARP